MLKTLTTRSHLLVTFLTISIILINSQNVIAGCEDVYFKPFSKQIFNENVSFLPFSETEDITGDGNLDLLGYSTAPNSGDVNKLYIYPGNGNAGFTQPTIITLPTTANINNFKIIDYNNDNKKDIAVLLDSVPNSFLVYLNDGNGNFSPLSLSSLSNGDESLINAVDINSDGISDVFTQSGSASFYRFGNSDGTLGNSVEISNAAFTLPADFNGDNKIDFPVISGPNDNRTIKFFINQGNGVFFLSDTSAHIADSIYNLFVKDLNNDGKSDLLASNDTSVYAVMNLGNESFSTTQYSIPNSIPNAIGQDYFGNIGDFDGDGFIDFIVTKFDSPEYLIFSNDGSGNFTSRQYQRRANANIYGDFDNDNKTDFLHIGTLSFQNTGGFTRIFPEAQISISKNVCSPFGETKIVDFNGDGRTDRTFWRSSDGSWTVKPEASQEVNFSWGTDGDIPVPGDYDGDQKTDYAVYRPSNGVWYIFYSGSGSFNIVSFGVSEDKPVASDYDGDGKTDIAVYRPSSGTWYILNSSNLQATIAAFGVSEDKPIPEDYDGDGKSDIAVFRPSTGVWYNLRSTDGNFDAIAWGVSSDTPIPADFDGDGKADRTIFRPADGVWYILRSNNFQYIGYSFGVSTDIPQVGDWDGNGIMDIGVFRPSTETWYSSHTYEGSLFSVDGGTPMSSIVKAR